MKKIYEKPAVAVIQYATSQMLATSWQVGDGETKPVIEGDPDLEISQNFMQLARKLIEMYR